MLRAAADQLAGPAGQAMRGVLGDVLRDPRRAAEFRAHARGNSRRRCVEIVRSRARRAVSSTPTSITQRQLEAGLALMRFHFLTNDGPIPDEVIVEIVDEIILPLFTGR